MIPKEIQRTPAGLGRTDRIGLADDLLGHARAMAQTCAANLDRGFSDFADEACDECVSRAECGLHVYEDTLHDAADEYQAVGLGLLADRVREIPATCVVTAWQEFDNANAATEV